MKLSDTIRDRLAAEIGPCPTCGHARQTIAGLAAWLGQPASSVGRYLSGGKPSVALLDAANDLLVSLSSARRPSSSGPTAPALTQDEAREFLSS